MMLEAWFPIGFQLPEGGVTRRILFEGDGWQILETYDGRALVVVDALMQRWREAGLVEAGAPFEFAGISYWSLLSPADLTLSPVYNSKSPQNNHEAKAFAVAMQATRKIDPESSLQDALYVERLSRVLPTYSIIAAADDAHVLGYWLTGGAHVSVDQFRRLKQMLSWLSDAELKTIVQSAGFDVKSLRSNDSARSTAIEQDGEPVLSKVSAGGVFTLAGRPQLEHFFNEHVVDIIQNRERYQQLGIGFPGAIALYGPPGCGKTFAVEELIEFLGWPSYRIDASSVASPYIHETSKKVANVFDSAIENAPAILVIDEMEAFLADREMGSGHHRVEEVAEFLRRIPEASKHDVLVIAMTNRIEMIDSAIMRRGRFDHVISVDYASEAEVLALLEKLILSLPHEEDVDIAPLAKKLARRPLSDVVFVAREGGRLAARSGSDRLNQQSLLQALQATPARDGENTRRIGFV